MIVTIIIIIIIAIFIIQHPPSRVEPLSTNLLTDTKDDHRVCFAASLTTSPPLLVVTADSCSLPLPWDLLLLASPLRLPCFLLPALVEPTNLVVKQEEIWIGPGENLGGGC